MVVLIVTGQTFADLAAALFIYIIEVLAFISKGRIGDQAVILTLTGSFIYNRYIFCIDAADSTDPLGCGHRWLLKISWKGANDPITPLHHRRYWLSKDLSLLRLRHVHRRVCLNTIFWDHNLVKL